MGGVKFGNEGPLFGAAQSGKMMKIFENLLYHYGSHVCRTFSTIIENVPRPFNMGPS